MQARKPELLQTAYECGLYHDVGKSAVIMYIDTNSRSLLEEEFCCIQSHPVIGCSLLRDAGYEEHLAPAALYHHCFYNGQGGYPRDVPPCPQDIKGIVDVLTVADALDAATDDIGRCYNRPSPCAHWWGSCRPRAAPAMHRTWWRCSGTRPSAKCWPKSWMPSEKRSICKHTTLRNKKMR